MPRGSESLDPQVAGFLVEMEAMGAAGMTDGTVAEARAANAAFLRQAALAGRPMASVREVAVPAPGRTVTVRAYAPPAVESTAIVYLHGGGWVLGGLDSYDAICRRLARATHATVYSVEYRLAPEHPFPAALEDASQVVEWAAAEHPDGTLIVAGDSSGGNLATAVALRAREAGPRLGLQVLLYPVLDHALDTESGRRFGEGHLLTRKDVEWFVQQYVPDEGDRDDPRVAPLRAPDLTGMPPTFLAVGSHDPLLDSCRAYADRLEAAGTPVTLRLCEGHLHGFLSLAGAVPAAELLFASLLGEIALAVERSAGLS